MKEPAKITIPIAEYSELQRAVANQGVKLAAARAENAKLRKALRSIAVYPLHTVGSPLTIIDIAKAALHTATPSAEPSRPEKCPQCGAPVIQTNLGGGKTDDYCEECGWPDENRTSAEPPADAGTVEGTLEAMDVLTKELTPPGYTRRDTPSAEPLKDAKTVEGTVDAFTARRILRGDDPDALLAEAEALAKAIVEMDVAFREFTSNEQRVHRGPEGQTIGSESYRLNYLGRQKAPLMDIALKALTAYRTRHPLPAKEALKGEPPKV